MHTDQVDLARWVLTGAELALVVLVVRVALAMALALAGRALRRTAGGAAHWCLQAAGRVGPRATSALVASVAGASLLVAGSGAAVADSPGATSDPPRTRGVPVLDRVLTSVASGGTVGWRDRDGRAVTVTSGDTLWSIAARALGGDETPGGNVPRPRVAAAWPRWYAANRDVIGPDPDRLVPGQRLRVPERPGPADRTARTGRDVGTGA